MGLMAGYMIQLRGYQWWQGSLVLLPGMITFVLTALAMLWPAEPNRRWWRIALGLVLMTLATWGMSYIDLYTSKYWLATLFAVWGSGVGWVVGPLLAVIFDGLTLPETIQGAGLFNMCRALPSFAAGACLVTLLTQQTDGHFDRLRLHITYNRPEVQRVQIHAAHYFTNQGSGSPTDQQQAHIALGRWVHANARAYAFQDVLGILTVLTGGASLLTAGIRRV